MSFPKHDAAVAYARSQIGVHEDPWGSNRGPIQRIIPRGGVDYYQEHDFLTGHGYPWCVDLGLTAWAVAGRPLPYKTAGAYDMLRWARANGWVRPSKDCVPGDLMVWHIGAGHLSILETQLGDRVTTIDGNHNNQVSRVTRSRSLLAGAIHVPEKVVTLPKPVPEPFWVIATSASGTRVLLFSRFASEKTVAGMLPRLLARYGKAGITIRRGGVRK